MNMQEAQRLALVALEVARCGSRVALQGYRSPKTIRLKGAIDLVTNYDIETEHVVRDELNRRTPEIHVVAEESGGIDQGALTWFVDPIDGTTNYAHGHPFWSVSIGLLECGMPVLGAVIAPSLHIEWWGWTGGRALRNGSDCRTSSQHRLQDALLATGFPYDRQTNPDNNLDAFVSLKKMVRGVRRCGSAAIDLCLVADGTYDGYWEQGLKPWDLVAGVAIVGAAGGHVTSLTGGTMDVRRGNLVASNGLIHDLLVAEIQRARPGLINGSGTR